MSALGQLIELRGIPTVAIGLVRLHMEKIRPPRGLWTPFQLGRPLGEPQDRDFQRRVLTRALRLLERADGPAILEDFPDDPPGWASRPGWGPPVALEGAGSSPRNAAEWRAAVEAEIAAIAPDWARARERFGRTTVGLSGMPSDAWPSFMTAFLNGELPSGPAPHHFAPALALRFVVDDVKAYYMEAAQSAGPQPASRQIDAWFWRETLAAKLLQVMRVQGMASGDKALKTVSSRFLVPAPFVAT